MPDEPSPLLERKLATILSADVVGYSRLMAENEEETLRIFRGHRQVFDSVVGMHRGRIFNTAGDAVLVEFPSAVEAVRCATEIQTALRTRNEQLPPGRRMTFRIGVNVGDVIVQEGDLLGDGVNVAARLQAAAEPEGICISGSVYDQIRNKLSLSFKSLGERRFKNIPQPVRTFCITETENRDALPADRVSTRWILRWVAATVLLMAVAGAYWTYSMQQRVTQMARREVGPAMERAAGRAQEEPARERRGAEIGPPAAPGREPANTTAPAAGSTPEAAPPAAAVGPPSLAANGAGQAAVNSGGPGANDGTYAGPICYGNVSFDSARCYRAQAGITQGKITGQWPGREPGFTMYLWGELSESGEATIHMQSRRADGSPLGTANLTGTLRNGRLDATGSFLNGRSVDLNWRRLNEARH
jgi:adenylate cyclase